MPWWTAFKGSHSTDARRYRIDPGRTRKVRPRGLEMDEGFRNTDLLLPPEASSRISRPYSGGRICRSPEARRERLSRRESRHRDGDRHGQDILLHQTVFELNRRYGWSKFIIVVPSIAIREGVFQSLNDTAEHFLEQYGKRARSFLYNSKQLHDLESFARTPAST